VGASRPPSMVRALDEALRGVEREDRDGAAVRLAKRYAALMDEDPACAGKIGPLLLDSLRELGMTPKSRASVVKGGGQGDGSGGSPKRAKLHALRDQHAAGARPN
jgi:hypothetical protein